MRLSDQWVLTLAVKSKSLVTAYYGEAPRFSYFEGGSTGGRQGLKIAQEYPRLYDGYLVGYPGLNANRFALAALYPQIVLRDELGFTAIDKPKIDAFLKKADAVNARAVTACDSERIGFLIDPFACAYDPQRDPAALCVGEAGVTVRGTNADRETCMTMREAGTIDRLWYGQTSDGSWAADQTVEDRAGRRLGAKQLWWGPSRGAPLGPRIRSAYTDNLVLAMERVDYAADATATRHPPLRNGSTSVRNRWSELSYADLARISDAGAAAALYGTYATNKTDLSQLRASGGKVLMHLGLSDELIPAAGNMFWYGEAAKRAGGYDALKRNVRLYLVPSVLHNSAQPYVPGGDAAMVPVPRQLGNGSDSQMFTSLMNWVEKGIAPGEMPVTSANGLVSYPLCLYPQKITWTGTGSSRSAGNYKCR